MFEIDVPENIIALYYRDNNHIKKALSIESINWQKKTLLIDCLYSFSFPYYSKEKRLTKEHIYK